MVEIADQALSYVRFREDRIQGLHIRQETAPSRRTWKHPPAAQLTPVCRDRPWGFRQVYERPTHPHDHYAQQPEPTRWSQDQEHPPACRTTRGVGDDNLVPLSVIVETRLSSGVDSSGGGITH